MSRIYSYARARAIDEGHVVALALLDLSSAFDTVDHPTLLSILQSRFSVTRQPLEWFRSYLTGRTQVFTTHSGHTLPVPLISGVPQGSSLGQPLPFPHTQSNTTCSLMILSPTVTVKFLKLHYTSSSTVVLYRLYLAKSYASLRLQLNPSKTEFIKDRSSRTHRTGPLRFFCCCSIHLELSTC